MALKKLEFTPESGNVDTYDILDINVDYVKLMSADLAKVCKHRSDKKQRQSPTLSLSLLLCFFFLRVAHSMSDPARLELAVMSLLSDSTPETPSMQHVKGTTFHCILGTSCRSGGRIAVVMLSNSWSS